MEPSDEDQPANKVGEVLINAFDNYYPNEESSLAGEDDKSLKKLMSNFSGVSNKKKRRNPATAEENKPLFICEKVQRTDNPPMNQVPNRNNSVVMMNNSLRDYSPDAKMIVTINPNANQNKDLLANSANPNRMLAQPTMKLNFSIPQRLPLFQTQPPKQ